MSSLYIVNHPSALAGCLELAGDQDAVLLIQEGVRASIENQTRQIFALKEDRELRSIKAMPGRNVELVDYAGFVKLTEAHAPIVSWR
jgi:sulfur relay protein TusB/DsrH